MRKTGVKLALLGACAGAGLLAGCGGGFLGGEDYTKGRVWSLTAQEDYYSESEQAQNPVGQAHSNVGTSATLYESTEQERGTGGAGEATQGGPGASRVVSSAALHATDQEQAKLWLQQDERVPFPPPQFSAVMADLSLGSGLPLRKGPNGAWIQGTHAVELGSRVAQAVAPSSGSYQPQESMEGDQSLPQEQPGEGEQAPGGQAGQPKQPSSDQ